MLDRPALRMDYFFFKNRDTTTAALGSGRVSPQSSSAGALGAFFSRSVPWRMKIGVP